MPTRRTVALGSLLLPAAQAFGAAKSTLPAAALPESVKSHKAPYPTIGTIDRLDPAFDKVIPPGTEIEKLAEGFDWIEGPLWVKKGGYLLFSEIPLNSIYRWQDGSGVSLFLKPSGYFGDRTDLKEPGSNALAIGRRGELIMCQHGERRLAKVSSLTNPRAAQVVVADKYDGKRFNSPNDLIVHSSGDIFFTDPAYGLGKKSYAAGKEMEDPDKELKFQGVYLVDKNGRVRLLHDGLERPNGVALSPDEKTLYVANSYKPRPIIMAFDVKPDRSITNARVFFDGKDLLAKRPDLKGSFDGLTVAADGTIFTSGPGGVLVLTSAGKHLGTLSTGEAMSNCELGGPDGKTLFVTSDMYLVRVRTTTRGIGF